MDALGWESEAMGSWTIEQVKTYVQKKFPESTPAGENFWKLAKAMGISSKEPVGPDEDDGGGE